MYSPSRCCITPTETILGNCTPAFFGGRTKGNTTANERRIATRVGSVHVPYAAQLATPTSTPHTGRNSEVNTSVPQRGSYTAAKGRKQMNVEPLAVHGCSSGFTCIWLMLILLYVKFQQGSFLDVKSYVGASSAYGRAYPFGIIALAVYRGAIERRY